MSINSKKTVKEFLKTYSLKEVNESTLINVLEKQGYTVVFFNSIYNDSDVSNIIQALNLEDYILSNRGFTYANDKYRLVFINEDLSEEDTNKLAENILKKEGISLFVEDLGLNEEVEA